MKKVLLLILLTLTLALPAISGYQIGDRVSDFTLRDSDGSLVSYSDYPDLIKFIVFWQPG
ncbi:MAG: hypothetical protein NTW14_10595 [bacterium]|nr:hypothetical protein [bacterium]